ncbi:MAG: type II TA system antitoxin MqsA family protein [Gammaproteobacteria bacterium]
MKCPNCGQAELVHGIRDMPYTYKGETTTIEAVTGDYCPACGEAVLEMGESVRTSAEMLEWNRQVNAESVDPKFIAGVRKKLNLDQREAASIFGGGVNAFSRYETGRTKPPLALVRLLRLLNNHPGLLHEILDSNKPHKPPSTKQPSTYARNRA